ncbi:MAG TPA: DNA translocase FtsK 4TM domain-containing protein [Myxococcota bacterium]|nr:DNA translocase FtsK 4TM domain-containing protein [Myxococcota bacterium]
MASKRRSRERGGGARGRLLRGSLVREAAGVACLALAAIAGLALATYDPADVAFRLGASTNAAGPLGATLAALLHAGIGAGAFVLVPALALLGIRLLLGARVTALRPRFWVGTALLIAVLATLPPLLAEIAPGRFEPGGGGVLGARLASAESALVHAFGALVLNALLLVLAGLAVLGVPPGSALAAMGAGAAATGRVTGRGLGATLRAAGSGAGAAAGAAGDGARGIAIWWRRRARRARVARQQEEAELPFEPALEHVADPGPVAVTAPAAAAGAGKRRAAPDIVDHRRGKKGEPAQEEFTFAEAPAGGPFTLPDVDIFQRPPEGGRQFDRDSLIMNSRILEKKLADFGVAGRVVTVHPGPVITMYEFEPAPGVKVNRITNLSDDLALALRALSIRIIAPIPGKSVVGIEVPNPEREVVYIRDLLESKSFRASASKLTLALGKDIFGNPLEADLATMPHLLVAGATGTGKSVFLNSLLCSILCRATPDEVKLLLVDPKLLELSVYEGIPHLIADVVTNPKRAAAALQGVVRKMEERYQMMAALGVRNIAQFNDRAEKARAAGEKTFKLRPKPGETEGVEVRFEKLAYIVVVIDELADLMVLAARDVEESLQRLAQMARASGIHLVLATQRPSVDVLTGVIKANFPARISFQVSSRIDSRTILDANGADQLLGQGDMLFLPPGTSKLQRLHGSYVSEREVARLVDYLRKQGSPQFDESLLRPREDAEGTEEGGEASDELYGRAVEIVAESRNASISYLQRRLKVGYNRAARMIEQMEQEGMVGPADGPKGREVFVRPLGGGPE